MQGGGEGGGGAHGSGSAGGYKSIRSRTPPKAMGDINVTPLVDVVLVLLLVFMITAPMMNKSIDVSIPQASVAQKEPPSNRVKVTVSADQRIYLNGNPVLMSMLTDQLHGMMEGKENKVVYLEADEKLLYGKVIEVVDHIKQAGVEQVGFVYVSPQEKARR
jgi:biopolymer transport protein ExbD